MFRKAVFLSAELFQALRSPGQLEVVAEPHLQQPPGQLEVVAGVALQRMLEEGVQYFQFIPHVCRFPHAPLLQTLKRIHAHAHSFGGLLGNVLWLSSFTHAHKRKEAAVAEGWRQGWNVDGLDVLQNAFGMHFLALVALNAALIRIFKQQKPER